MKELSIEEKAKHYDEALERAESIYNEIAIPSATTKGICTYIFPELKECKESEDNKIKDAAIEFVRQNKSFNYRLGISKEEVIAWLEKSRETNKLQVSDELYEHIRNTYACIDDALSSETLADINDYLSMAKNSAKSAFDMIKK